MNEGTTIRILCASDIHLGRAPAFGETPWMPLTERSAWDFVVQSALDRHVDLLLLAGDVIEGDNRFFETRGPLKEGLLRLLEAGIAVAAVAGNHDHEVFPGLHRDLKDEAFPQGAAFHLLGAAASWSVTTIPLAAGPVTIAGWSFPSRHYPSSPLRSCPPLDPSGPLLGLLHGDLLDPGSPYGPLRAEELDAHPVDKWVLGHIHAPTGQDGRRHFYCGSPLPLRSTERGAHGCWLLEYTGRDLAAPVLVPAPVRVDDLEVALAGSGLSLVDIMEQISAAVRRHVFQALASNPGLRTQFLSLRVTGESEVPVNLAPEDFPLEYEGVQVRLLGPAEDQCLPPLPMAEWALESSVRGRLARLLLSLQRGEPEPEAARLTAEILRRERQSRDLPAFNPIEPSLWESAALDEAWARETLMGSLRALLARIRQQEAPRG